MSRNKKKKWLLTAGMLAAAFCILNYIGKKDKEKSSLDIDRDNWYLNQEIKNAFVPSVYERSLKPMLDKVLSFAGLVVLFPVYLLISLAIHIDDPGPVLFTQKRVGKDKHFFQLHNVKRGKF